MQFQPEYPEVKKYWHGDLTSHSKKGIDTNNDVMEVKHPANVWDNAIRVNRRCESP